MTAAVLNAAPTDLRALAEKALSRAAAAWLATALVGQWAFFAYIAAFYGPSTASGDFEAWNRIAAMGGRPPYVPGDTAGNLAYAAHALGAGVIAFGGALQLIPQVRARWPRFHRWNGRVFLTTVVALSLSGFYLIWGRDRTPPLFGALSITLNGVLILAFAGLALRAVLSRDLAAHRRWAMRLYLVSNAQWFFRVGAIPLFAISAAFGAKMGLDHPVMLAWAPGCYLLPLAVLEIYLRAKAHGGTAGRFMAAGVVGASTLVMGLGALAFSAFSFFLVSGAPLPKL